MQAKAILMLITLIIISGCMQKQESINQTTATLTPTPSTPTATAIPTPTPNETEIQMRKFKEWLLSDQTNMKVYTYWSRETETYDCRRFTNDFINNATQAGFEAYGVALWQTPDRGMGHAIAAVVINDTWFFLEPQADMIISKAEIYQAYQGKYKYAQFGKRIGQVGATYPITYHPIIGLNGSSWMKLKEE